MFLISGRLYVPYVFIASPLILTPISANLASSKITSCSGNKSTIGFISFVSVCFNAKIVYSSLALPLTLEIVIVFGVRTSLAESTNVFFCCLSTLFPSKSISLNGWLAFKLNSILLSFIGWVGTE